MQSIPLTATVGSIATASAGSINSDWDEDKSRSYLLDRKRAGSVHLLDNKEEPGIYNRGSRITVVMNKLDAFVNITVGQLVELMQARNAAPPSQEPRRPMWIDIQNARQDQIGEIAQVFGMHPITVEDCFVEDAREKLERVGGYLLLVITERSYVDYTNITQTVNLHMLIFPDVIVTIHQKPVKSVHEVIPRLEYCPMQQIPSVEWVVHIILDRLIDIYELHVTQIENEAESLDEMVVRTDVDYSQSELLERINQALSRSAQVAEGLVPKREILAALSRNTTLFSANGIRYVKNVHDAVIKNQQKIKLTRNLLSSVNNVYITKISLQQSQLSNETGEILMKFGVVAAIFMPLNLITAIGGMNVLIPGSVQLGGNDNAISFSLIIMVIVIIGCTLLFSSHKLGWF